MIIADRLRTIRESKKLSQGHIQDRTGLLRCYVSRVENGHTVPSIETLEKFARALEVPLYQLFYEGEGPPKQLKLPNHKRPSDYIWGDSPDDTRSLNKLRHLLSKMQEHDQRLLLHLAQKMAVRRPQKRITRTKKTI